MVNRVNFVHDGKTLTRARQSGAALVISLIFMLIISLLAVTSMTSSMQEEKMAAGFQDYGRALMAAEVGLERAMDDDDAFDVSNDVDDNDTATVTDDVYDYEETETGVGGYGAAATYNAVFRQKTIPKRGSGWDASLAFYHFDMASAGSTASGASTSLHAGAYQVGKK